MKLYTSIFLSLFFVFINCAFCEDNIDKNHPEVLEKIQQWNRIFPGCDLTKKNTFSLIMRIQPRLEKEFTPLGDAVFSSSDQRLDREFLNNVIKGELLRNFSDMEVSGYYLSDGSEPSKLLYNDLKNPTEDGYSMQISGCMIMLTINPSAVFSEKKGITQDDMKKILENGFNLTENELNSFEFHAHSEMLKPGTIIKKRNLITNQSKSWNEQLLLIVSSNGISFIFPKVRRNAMRASKGFPCDFDWLNKRLYAPDGKLIDDRFKIIREGTRKRAVKIK